MAWSSIASICHFSSLGGTGTLQSHAIPIFFVAPIMTYRVIFRMFFPKQAKQRYIPPCPCSHGIALQLHWQAAHQRPGLCQSHSATPEDFLYLNHVAWFRLKGFFTLTGWSCSRWWVLVAMIFFTNWKSDDWVVPKNMDCHSSKSIKFDVFKCSQHQRQRLQATTFQLEHDSILDLFCTVSLHVGKSKWSNSLKTQYRITLHISYVSFSTPEGQHILITSNVNSLITNVTLFMKRIPPLKTT